MKISIHSYYYKKSGKRVLDIFLDKQPIKLVNSYIALEKIGDSDKELLWNFYKKHKITSPLINFHRLHYYYLH